MAVVEDIELRVKLDGSLAQKGLDAVRDAAERMGGGLTKVIGSLEGMQKGSRELQQKLAPTAAAISGVSSALGQAGGEAGKVVAGFGQMAAAFGAGGPWAVAIVGATMLVDQYIVAQKEMEANARDADVALNAFGDNLRNRSGKGLEWIREKADEAARAVRDFGKTSAQVTVDTARLEITATEARIKGIDDTIARRDEHIARLRAEINDPAVIQSRRDIIDRMESLRDENILLTKAKQTREELTASLKGQQDETRRLITQQAALRELEDLPEGSADLAKKGGGTRPARAAAGEEIDSTVAMLLYVNELREKATGEYLSARQAAAKESISIVGDEIDAEVEGMLWLKSQREQASKDYVDLKHKEAEQTKELALGALGVVTSATQDYVDARIKGEENAEAAFAAAIMRQAGQALISYGTQTIGRGIMELSSPVTAPLAAVSFATGAGLITGGIALGGVATGVMHAAGGGTIGQPIERSTSGGGSDMAARARPARPGMGGGGGTNLTIVYGGLSGPSADDGARALGRGFERARRRGLSL